MTTEIANPVWETECSDKYRPILEKICMSGLYNNDYMVTYPDK